MIPFTVFLSVMTVMALLEGWACSRKARDAHSLALSLMQRRRWAGLPLEDMNEFRVSARNSFTAAGVLGICQLFFLLLTVM